MHIHDIHWQILDVNGVPPSAGDAGPKDTFLVPRRVAGVPGTLRVLGTFTDNVGDYVSHCHNLEHEDHAMMFTASSRGDAGPKDTFLVPRRVAGVSGTLRVQGTFTDNVGDYVSHCHNLEHEDHAMMFNFQVQP